MGQNCCWLKHDQKQLNMKPMRIVNYHPFSSLTLSATWIKDVGTKIVSFCLKAEFNPWLDRVVFKGEESKVQKVTRILSLQSIF